jgi:hypothetical protein
LFDHILPLHQLFSTHQRHVEITPFFAKMAAPFVVGNPANVSPRPDAAALSKIKDMTERTRMLFLNEALSDAILIVGCFDKQIPVHSLFLQSSSEVMATMFSANWKKSEPIVIKDFDEIFDFAVLHEHEELRKKSHDWIGHRSLSETNRIVTMAEFVNLSSASVTVLVSDENLLVAEIVLFWGCLQWAKAECIRNGKDETPEELRFVMSPFIEEFAFATMDPNGFATSPCDSGVLTSEEQALVFRSMFNKTVKNKFRAGRGEAIVKAEKISLYDWVSCKNSMNGVTVAIYKCGFCNKDFCGKCLMQDPGDHQYSMLSKSHRTTDFCGGPPGKCFFTAAN